MRNRVHFTIGISVFNEEKNIENLLQAIFHQELGKYILKEVLLYSDGSTDETVAKARRFSRKKLIIKASKKRLGQWARMNEIIRDAKGDIIVFLDGDIVPTSQKTLMYLLKGFEKSKKVGMVCGNPVVYQGGSYMEKAVALTARAYEELKEKVRGGNNVFGVSGNILAIRTDVARGIKIAPSVYATDAYLYFSILRKGYTFLFIKKATVWNRVPATIRDQINQNKRFKASPYHLKQFFGDEVTKAYKIPPLLYISAVLKQFLRHPIACSYIFLINLYCGFLARRESQSISSAWHVSETTKKGIIYDG